MLQRIQWHLGTGGSDCKCHWEFLGKREAGIIPVTTTWEEEVSTLKWLEEKGVKQINPKV